MILRPPSSELVDDRLLSLTFMEEVGLFQSISARTARTFRLNEDGQAFIREGPLVLVFRFEDDEISIPMIQFTRAGREVCRHILSPVDPADTLTNLATVLRPKVSSLELHEILSDTGHGAWNTTVVRKL